MPITAITVFCGSKSGNNPIYEQHATTLGNMLAQQHITLIYGGGGKGLMGAVANGTLAANGKVIGIIPEILLTWEHHHKGITELIVVDNMHTRKKMLYEKCDAAIILPGGFGTLDELFEMLTWNQLSIHNKKIVILNSGGFYTHLLAHAKAMQQDGFLYDKLEERIIVIDTPEQLAQYL
jgi:uncharacterized protein (TIGR00730 family)